MSMLFFFVAAEVQDAPRIPAAVLERAAAELAGLLAGDAEPSHEGPESAQTDGCQHMRHMRQGPVAHGTIGDTMPW